MVEVKVAERDGFELVWVAERDGWMASVYRKGKQVPLRRKLVKSRAQAMAMFETFLASTAETR